MDLRISTGRVTSVQATRRLRLALAISAAAPVLALAAAAHAAAAAAPTDEVVVTAEKRSETLREVPQSVSVVSADKLEKQQAFSLQDFVSQVPNLSIAQEVPGQGRVVLRSDRTPHIAYRAGRISCPDGVWGAPAAPLPHRPRPFAAQWGA